MPQPASRGWRQRLAHWWHADLPHAYFRVNDMKPSMRWWVKATLRKAWLWRDISPGPITASLLWFWFHYSLGWWVIVSTVIASLSIWWDADHGRTANADRVRHKAKRRWQRACLDADIKPIPALVGDPELRPHKTVLHVEAIEGTDDFSIYRKATRRLGTIYHSKVKFDPANDGTATVTIHHYDPLKDEPELPVYLGNGNGPEVFPTWKALPIGVDQDGEVFTVSLHQHHMLVAGMSGSGKSTSVEPMICSCIAARHIEPWAGDPTDVSLGPFRNAIPYAADPDSILDLVLEFHRAMEKREAEMAERDVSLAYPCAEWPLRILWLDEFLSLVDPDLMRKNYVDRLNGLCKDVLRRGRKTAHSLVVTATDPRASLLVDGFRSAFHYRLCFKVATADDSTIALGKGRVVDGFKPHELPDVPGRAVFTGGGFYQLRTWRTWDDTTRQVVQTLSRPVIPADPADELALLHRPDPTYQVSEQSVVADSPGSGLSHRDRIYDWLVRHGPQSVAEIVEGTGINASAVKWHLGLTGQRKSAHPIPIDKFPNYRYGLAGR